MRKLLFILFISFISNSFAQNNYEFSGRINKYTYELNEFLTYKASKDKKKKIELLITEFSNFWNSDTLSQTNKNDIIAMSNVMVKKRFQASPTFLYFIDNILSIKRDEDNSANFNDWFKSLDYFIKRKRTGNLHKYFISSSIFFKTHHIYEKGKKIWKLSNGRMKIIDEKHYPVFVFSYVDIIGTTGKDSSYILRTSGKYYPLKQRWKGQGGKIFWNRVGLDTAVVFANLRKYKIDLKTSIWRADSVDFYDRRTFDFALSGRIRDKFGYSNPIKTVLYPSFDSYRHDYLIKDIFSDIDFYGGYNLQGLKLVGKGEGKANAFFIFKHNGTKFVWAGAQNFIIDDDKILSERVNTTIYLASIDSVTGELELDSIYHPGLSLYYSNIKRNLSIYRKEEGMSKTPFLDSYHNVDLYVEELNWKMGEDYIDMKSIQQKGIESKSYFESVSLFSSARYDKLQGIDRINPVRAVYNYIEEVGFDEFYAEEFGNYMHLGKAETIGFLLNLASKGFLIYDAEEMYVIVKPSVRTYVLANQGKIDYDVISFNSVTDGNIPNASLNLLNNEIVMQGVHMVYLSDSQDVRIFPKYGRVVLKKNRDFTFDGKIMAGRFDLYAHDCYFSYDKFELDLPSIDSLSFKVESFEKNDYDENPLVRVKAVIEDLKGNILIDHPNNKSGRESFPEYPILNSKTKSYVYYDKSSIYNKVYDREHFFYRLNSFTIDSLDDFKTDGLQFEGYLSSAGIFPDIEEPLMVQQDYSLGFNTATPEEGWDLYGGVGKYSDSLSLTNEGLIGKGSLKYLTSTSYSEKFMFFPDSTNSFVDAYLIDEQVEGVEYPPVIASSLDEHWEPYNDLMVVNTTNDGEPMKMYGNEAKMTGELYLSSKDLKGDGLIEIKNAEMEAENFVYLNRSYHADSCIFKLRTFVDASLDEAAALEASNKYAYRTEDKFKANVDFDQRKGVFESTSGTKPVVFEENMYMCFMDKFTWYMDEDISEFGSSTKDPFAEEEDEFAEFDDYSDVGMSGTQFISLHPKQDSLNFFAASALYMQREKLIHAFEVPILEVADAVIIPNSHEVMIRAKAKMDEVTDAVLNVNRVTKYHSLYNGTFNIKGRHNYSGRALYDYEDEDKNIQNIFFDKISVDTAGYTIGTAKIDNSANFSLSKNFDFEGGVTLIGGIKFLSFNGGTRLNYDCDTLEHEQIRFVAEIDPMKIRIPIGEEVKNYKGYKLFSGMKAKVSNGYSYSSFLTSVGSKSDHIIMQSMGFLMFDNISQEYRIASEDKLDQMSLPGNYLSLSRRSCTVYSEGELNILYNSGHVEADAYGEMKYYKRLDSSALNVSIPLNFYFNEKALEVFTNDLNAVNDADAVDLQTNNVYEIMLKNKLGFDRSEELMSKIKTSSDGRYRKVPKELIKTIFISDVRFKYNRRSRSFVSSGPIGIASIGKEQILKYIEGKIEIQNKGSVYKVTMAFEVGSGYYFFQIKGNQKTGQVLAYSSNNEFNTLIKEAKSDDRKYKEKGKQGKFNYYISTPTAYKKFKRMMKMKQ